MEFRIISREEYEKYKRMSAVDRIVYLNNHSLPDKIKLLADISDYEKLKDK